MNINKSRKTLLLPCTAEPAAVLFIPVINNKQIKTRDEAFTSVHNIVVVLIWNPLPPHDFYVRSTLRTRYLVVLFCLFFFFFCLFFFNLSFWVSVQILFMNGHILVHISFYFTFLEGDIFSGIALLIIKQ